MRLPQNFIDRYEAQNPDFVARYCPLADLYDSDLDMFHIEEVQDEYEEFKGAQKHDFS